MVTATIQTKTVTEVVGVTLNMDMETAKTLLDLTYHVYGNISKTYKSDTIDIQDALQKIGVEVRMDSRFSVSTEARPRI